jgi:hypothetical protein
MAAFLITPVVLVARARLGTFCDSAGAFWQRPHSSTSKAADLPLARRFFVFSFFNSSINPSPQLTSIISSLKQPFQLNQTHPNHPNPSK